MGKPRPRSVRFVLILFAFSFFRAFAFSTGSPNDQHPTPNALAQRLDAVSRRHLGTPYRLDPLGEGTAGTVDRDPLYTWRCADCVTFVEQSLAEALAAKPADVPDVLRRIRYRGGIVSFETRNHYMVADWLPNNRWGVTDITVSVGGSACRVTEKRIDRAALMRQRGGDPAKVRPAERLRITYVPRAALLARLGLIPNASLLLLITARPGIDVSHVGLIFARGNARIFRHASELRGRVIEEPLAAYLARAPGSVVGAKVCGFRG
jgi:D-alanyl-D-alanine carboxypeptidase/D-alanyl-D-alanine-endopeptidase (penicillin-binding protein 4)